MEDTADISKKLGDGGLGSNRWRAVRQGNASVIGRQACHRVSRLDVVQGLEKLAAEIADAGETLPELLVERVPSHKLGLARWHAVQALR